MGTAIVDLNNDGQTIDTSNDNIVIRDVFEEIRGGRSLDTTSSGITAKVINAGHVIISEDATGICKPWPVSGAAYAALPGGHSVVGIQIATVLTAKPMVGIMNRGNVNPLAAPYPYTTPQKTALPLITFLAD